jgi:hypothetical protein
MRREGNIKMEFRGMGSEEVDETGLELWSVLEFGISRVLAP